MKKVIPALLWAVASTSGLAYSQQFVSISVTDSKSSASIANATVEELGSGLVVATDSAGNAEFPTPFAGDRALQFKVDAPGFPTRFFQRTLLETPVEHHLVSHHTLEITEANELVSPIIGPSGGSKSATIPTGYFLSDPSQGPDPMEYSQSVSVVIPSGALAANYRIGISLIPGAGQAENLMNIGELGNKTPFAQFEVQWLDASGSPTLAPILAKPLTIEMTPSSLFLGEGLIGVWNYSLCRFDDSSSTWVAAPAGRSGLNSAGQLWAELTEGGYYSFMGHRVDLSADATRDVVDKKEWVAVAWTGISIADSDVTCPNLPVNPGGAQTYASVTHGVDDGSIFSAAMTAEMAAALKLAGLKSEFSSTGSGGWNNHWGTYRRQTVGWSDHAYAGEGQGKIYLHLFGFTIQEREYRFNTDAGTAASWTLVSESDPIQTGYTVRKALRPCP